MTNIRVVRGEAMRAVAWAEMPPNEEGILLLPGGELCTLLPGMAAGDACREAEALIRLDIRATCEFAAGAGGVSLPGGDLLGGWASLHCVLLSPRRFVAGNREALLAGAAPESLLVGPAREAMRSAFEAYDGRRLSLWEDCRRRAASAMLEQGWQLAGFRPEALRRSREAA